MESAGCQQRSFFCAEVDESWVDVDSTAFVGWGYKCPACCYLRAHGAKYCTSRSELQRHCWGWLHTCVGVAVQTAILVSCPGDRERNARLITTLSFGERSQVPSLNNGDVQ